MRYEEMPDSRLHERIMELVELKQIPRSPESLARIKKEMACISFEQEFRYAESHPELN